MRKLLISLFFALLCMALFAPGKVFASTPTTVSNLMDVLAEEKQEAVYDIKLNAPFSKEKSGIRESVNPETGEVIVRNNVIRIPGRNKKDLSLDLVYRSRDAKLYDEGTKSDNLTNSYGQTIKAYYDVFDVNGYWLRTDAMSYTTSDTVISGNISVNGESWIFNGYLQYDGGTSVFTSGSIINTKKVKSREAAARYVFGEGWSLDIPHLNVDGNSVTVNLRNGQTYTADFSTTAGLKDYPLSDIVFSKDTSRSSGADSSAYKLYYANGDAYYFSARGELLLETDRFGNTITYVWEDVNGKKQIVRIMDTVGRTVDISYNPTVTSFRYGDYSVNMVKSPIPGVENLFVLSSFIDAAGRETKYGYIYQQANFDLVGKTAAQNTYANMVAIKYPTGLKTTYNYISSSKNLGSSGSMGYFKVAERYDLDGEKKYNLQTYKYYNEPDGYPLYKTGAIDNYYKYHFEVKDSRGLLTKYTYNFKHLMDKKEQIKDKLLAESRVEYHGRYNLPIRYENKTYNNEGNAFEKQDIYEYDTMGNVILENHPENDKDIESDEHKIQYAYDYEYNLLINKKYKKDKDTSIEIRYKPGSDKKSIEAEEILSNGKLLKTTKYEYNKAGNVTCVSYETNPGEWTTVKYEFGPQYKEAYLTAVIHKDVKDADGYAGDTKEEYSYDFKTGNKIKSTDGNGNTTEYTYDRLGRIIKETLPDKHYRSYNYDDKNNIITRVDANNNSLVYYYNNIGKLDKVVEPSKGIELVKFEYDDNEATICKYDGNSNARRYSYDELNRITSVTNEDSIGRTLQKKEVSYDSAYLDRYGSKYYKITVKEKGDSADRVQNYYFDTYERLLKLGRLIDGSEEFSSFNYDYLGNRTEESVFSGEKFAYVYDALGRLVKSIDAEGKERKYTYNLLGNVTSRTDELGITYFVEYDSLGRKTAERSPFDGSGYSETKYFYDGAGNLVKTIDPEGYVTKQYFNARNIFYGVEKVINSRKSNIVKLEHDYEGNVVTVMKGLDSWLDEEYSKRAYEFDTLNRQTAITDESSRRTDFTYDNNSNLIKKTDRNGVATIFKYDGLNRLVEKINDKDGSRNSISIAYDLLGNRKAIKDASGDRYFDYDILGRVKYINYSNGIRKYYNYDNSDRVTNFKVMQGSTEEINLSYEYDKSGRLTCVNESGRSFTYGYDDAGRLVKAENKVTGLESVYNYYPSGNLKSLMHYIADDLKKTYGYKYDMRGNQVEKDENGIVTKYHYDPLGRLKAAELPSDRLQDYEYDDFGNRTKLIEADGNTIKETSYEYGIDSRLLLSETKVDDDLTQKRFEYDPEGNLLKSLECFKYKGSLTAEKAISYHYDGYNQLSMVEGPNANIYEYTYDSNGLRIRKTFGDEVINYINEGGNIILETNKDMKITARNIRGSRLIYRETDLTYYGYIQNGHGDIIGLTDDKGNIIKDYSYDPFGREEVRRVDGFGNNRTVEVWRNEVEKIDNPFRYCGEYQDVETGNIYLRARYYNPEIGRFISEDSYEGSIRNPLSLNLYIYCQGNPIKYTDPSGHDVGIPKDFEEYDSDETLLDEWKNSVPFKILDTMAEYQETEEGQRLNDVISLILIVYPGGRIKGSSKVTLNNSLIKVADEVSNLPVLHSDQVIINNYQRYYSEAWSQAIKKFNQGKIVIPPEMNWKTVLGQEIDRVARYRLKTFLTSNGIEEGTEADVLVNRWLRDPSGSGKYRIPDVRLKQTGTILEGTIGDKTMATPQIQDFINFSGGDEVIIIKP